MKSIFIVSFALLVAFGFGYWYLFDAPAGSTAATNSGTIEKMVVANGTVSMNVNLGRLNGSDMKGTALTAVNFSASDETFFKAIAFNGELRALLPGTLNLRSQGTTNLPGKLGSLATQLTIESLIWGDHELVVRDSKSGFVFFNVEGQTYDLALPQRSLSIRGGRLLLSKEFAADLGRPGDAGTVVGDIAIEAAMRTIEVSEVVNDEVKVDKLPADPLNGSVPGPDVIVGDLSGLAQFGNASGTQVGLAIATDSCNLGTIDLDWVANPSNNHPVIPQNMYRMSGGATNDERFEQIGQSSVKHAFTALTENLCNLGCNGVGGSRLGSGCSDPYSASLNSGGSGNSLGSRAWINPFTGAYPRNDDPDVTKRNNNHSGHAHGGPSHRILTEIADLTPSQNAGATYYAEGQYITPHEYAHCQANPTQCNMNNNVSYRRYNVTNSSSPFTFSAAAATERQKAAIQAWTGATIVDFRPDAVADGMGTVGYKVTNPSAGVWHYEYAVYNMNLERAIQSFSVPLPAGVTISNVGFHAPPQHPAWAADGTVGQTGFSSTPWAQSQANNAMTWSSETFAQNQNANAIRWGTLYNFRFDSNRPPQNVNATIGFFKNGSPMQVQVQGPAPLANATVAGRVTTLGWRGVSYAKVTISDGTTTQTVYTNSFGYFSFSNVTTGATYTITVTKRRFSFTPKQLQVNGNLSGITFVNGQ